MTERRLQHDLAPAGHGQGAARLLGQPHLVLHPPRHMFERTPQPSFQGDLRGARRADIRTMLTSSATEAVGAWRRAPHATTVRFLPVRLAS